MNATLKIISPVDGSVYAERPLADDATVLATLERARSRATEWREVPVAERVKIATAFTDAMVADKARVSEVLAWQMGRPIRYGPGEVRGFEERARYMIAIAAGGARRHRRRAEGRLHALHPPRAARRRAQSAGVEFPVHDGAQRRAAGDPCRQHGGDEALEPDGAGRRALRRLLQKGESSQGRVSGPSHVARGDAHGRSRSGLVDQVGFTGSTAGGRAVMASVGGGAEFPGDVPGTRRQGPGLRPPRRQHRLCRREHRRRRLFQLRPVVLRHRAHLCPRGCLRPLRRGGGGDVSTATSSARRPTRRRRSDRWCAPRLPTSSASRWRRRSAGAPSR